MDLVKETFQKLLKREISLKDAEYSMRFIFDEENLDEGTEKYREAYYYLDEVVGVIDLDDEKNYQDSIDRLFSFIKKIPE